jgi:hypothetical protein
MIESHIQRKLPSCGRFLDIEKGVLSMSAIESFDMAKARK